MTDNSAIRVGTRASPLALAQTALAIAWLGDCGVTTPFTSIPIKTSGDRILDRPLYDEGGKALFAKELEEALLENKIDLAVHSLKDVEVNMPQGLVIGAYLPRGAVGDALVSHQGWSLSNIPAGSVIGTVSPRRQVSILHCRPDVMVKPVRGNLGTRLGKLDEGAYDALIMAEAGLKRLQIASHPYVVLDIKDMLPAASQGAIAIQCREDSYLRPLLEQKSDLSTKICIEAERALLRELGGSCRTPVGAYAVLQEDVIWLRGMFATDITASPVFGEARGTHPHSVAKQVASILR